MAAMSFQGDVQSFTRKFQLRGDLVIRKVALDLFSRVVIKTPVDTGRARGNWMVGVNRIPTEEGPGIDTAPMPRIISDVSAAKFGDNVALSNTLPYIGPLEYGGFPDPPMKGTRLKGGGYEIKSAGGYSKQAPQGMVRTTIKEYQPTLRKAVAEAKRETP